MGLRPVNHLTLSSVLRRRASARAQLRPTLKRIDLYVIRWVRRKFKRLRRKPKGARDWFDRLRRVNPTLFTHWQLCHGNGRTSEPYESRGSRTDLGAPGVETPLGRLDITGGSHPSGASHRKRRQSCHPAQAGRAVDPTRICLSIYRGTAATLGFAKPAVSSPWAHNVLK
jgi:hypothetical protein